MIGSHPVGQVVEDVHHISHHLGELHHERLGLALCVCVCVCGGGGGELELVDS